MTRIIAGGARGTLLAVPSAGTRPTSDRARESLFSSLESADAIAGARVLDLYAGSGALGLEALSRGGVHADLVERSAAAARVAQANAVKVTEALGGVVTARVHRRAAHTFLAAGSGAYDLVFADPPYAVTDAEIAALLEALVPRLAADGLIVLERAARSPSPAVPTALGVQRQRRYGDTALWWLQRDTDPHASPAAASGTPT